jgi:hypothetical protein
MEIVHLCAPTFRLVTRTYAAALPLCCTGYKVEEELNFIYQTINNITFFFATIDKVFYYDLMMA